MDAALEFSPVPLMTFEVILCHFRLLYVVTKNIS